MVGAAALILWAGVIGGGPGEELLEGVVAVAIGGEARGVGALAFPCGAEAAATGFFAAGRRPVLAGGAAESGPMRRRFSRPNPERRPYKQAMMIPTMRFMVR